MDGGEPKRVTAGESDIHPAWSPKGSEGRVAFARESGGRLHVWVMPVGHDGISAGPPSQLTHGDADESAPAWSPDGTRIAYVAEPRELEGDVFLVPADRSAPPVPVTIGAGALRVQWYGQDGRMLVVVGRWGGAALEARLVDIAGRAVKPFSPPVIMGENTDIPDLAVSADGRWLAFARDDRQGNLYLLDRRTTRR